MSSTALQLPNNFLYRSFVDWQAQRFSPEFVGPKSLKEFCLQNNCEKSALAEITKQNSYGDDLLTATLDWVKQKTPELIHAIYREVKNSHSVVDLERLLAIVYDLKKKERFNNQFNFISTTLTSDQYAAIIAREARVLEASRPEPTVELLSVARS